MTTKGLSTEGPASAMRDGGGDTMPDDLIVQLCDVSVSFPVRSGVLSRRRDPVLAVDDVNLEVRQGQTLGVVGDTGAGKSTIARLVMGMVKATAGRVNVAGFDLAEVSGDERRELDRLRQVVLQDPFSSLNPRMRVRDIIAEPLTAGAAESRREIRSSIDGRVAELLRMVGLPEERARAYPHQFSGGQRQRISIARALAPRPKLIVLDEPTSALDLSVRAQILTLLRNLQEELGLTYLVISHDLMTVAYLTSMASSKVAVMYRGRVVEVGPTGRVFHSPRHPYTLRLLSSVPRADIDFLSRSDFFEAEDSGASLPESSCRYAGRCVLRAGLGSPGQCNSEPPLNDVGPDHRAACHFSDEVDEFSWSEEG